MKRNMLELAVAMIMLVLDFWLVLSLRTWYSVESVLQGCAVALVVWVFLTRGGRSVGLVELVGKGFGFSLLWMSVLWFMRMLVVGSLFPVSVSFWVFVMSFELIVFPLSLLSVAISVTAYSLFRARLWAWQVFLSSWYVSIYGVFAGYDVWWFVFVRPYLRPPYYFSGAGAIALDMFRVGLAFFIAGIFTVVYLGLRRPKERLAP